MSGRPADVRLLADQAYLLLDAVPGLNAFDGEVVDPPRDEDGGVHALAAFFASSGRRLSDGRLSARPNVLEWSFQVTCVGGDRERALWAVQRVTGALTGRRLVVAGRESGMIQEVGDPGPMRVDHRVDPPEVYTSIDFRVLI